MNSSRHQRWSCVEMEGDEGVHLVPAYGRAHTLDRCCWCDPAVELHFGLPLVTHRDGLSVQFALRATYYTLPE